MPDESREDELIRSAALQNAQSIFFARQRAEKELFEAKEALERKTEELYEQREWFRVTLSSIGDAVIATDIAGAVTFLNPIAERLTGWSAAEAAGRPITEVLPLFNEQTGAPAVDPVERVLRERIAVELANHTVLRSRGGREIPIEDSAAPILNDSGGLRGVILVFHDVSEKHARERGLREAEWLARSALEIGRGGAWIIEADRGIVSGDAMVARTFNIPPERCREGEAVATFIDAIHPEDRERVRRVVIRSMETGESYQFECRALGSDGVLRWLEARGRLERDAPGRPVRLPGVVLDLSARKVAERTLAERERLSRLRADLTARLVEDVAINEKLRTCCDLIVQHVEAAFARVWTIEPGKTALTLSASSGIYSQVDGAESPLATSYYDIGFIAQSRRPFLTNDVANDPNITDPEWARREGMIGFAGHPLIAGDKVLGVLVLYARQALSDTVISDLGPLCESIAQCIERKYADDALTAAKEQAEAASRAKDSFLAALSHELRTPLAPVMMTAAALRDDETLSADAREQLLMIERNIALEARLIDDLLDLTRISQGKLLLRRELCDTHSLVGLAVEIVREDAMAKGIVIQQSLEAKRSGLMADPTRLEQVMWNLLRNAVKFTPRGGRIAIKTSNFENASGEPSLRVEVSDSGIGIEPPDIQRIFEAFEQGGRSGEHRFGGLGLGLSIARAITDLHGGKIRAESAGAGSGATFILEIPHAMEAPGGLAAPHEYGSDSPARSGDRNAGGSLRLLVVEDHRETLDVLTRLLTRAGHSVVPADSIETALAAAAKAKFDVVISDLGLPDGTGADLMAQLRERHSLRGIALSGYGMEEDTKRARDAGFVGHLVKPVDFHQLRRMLETLDD